MKNLKYQGYTVVFQEVPNEVSLAFNISGCPYKCRGCHSQNLWEYSGNLLKDDFYTVFDLYRNNITCLCFMGGDQNAAEIIEYCKYAHNNGIKTCLYTGGNSISEELALHLDYLKTGGYISDLGGLDSPSTNQRMYRLKNGQVIDDITHRFWERGFKWTE